MVRYNDIRQLKQILMLRKIAAYLVVLRHLLNNLGFPGQYFDSEINKYYNWHRYYFDKIGRYDSFDPILHPANAPPFKATSCGKSSINTSFNSLLFIPSKLNPFIYVINNPTNLIDPSGLALSYDDCKLMKDQEEITCSCIGKLLKDRVCPIAFDTCTTNCNKLYPSAGGDVKGALCKAKCTQALTKCLQGKCFTFPDELKKDCN